MNVRPIDVCAVGHICLDIIPRIKSREISPATLYTPGGLIEVKEATLTLGGSVANTGLALHRLGAKVQTVGQVGNDLLGRAVLELLRGNDPSFAERMLVTQSAATSYSIVLSVPGYDRCFLHFPGANESFAASDLYTSQWSDTRIVHFGYPPLMPAVVTDGGTGLAKVLSDAQGAGSLTSLDMAMPAEKTAIGNSHWRKWLERVLPAVDLFLPSLDELLLMWDPQSYTRLVEVSHGKNLADLVSVEKLSTIAEELLAAGTPLIMIKLGDRGLFLRTHPDIADYLGARHAWQEFDWKSWADLRLTSPCWEVPMIAANGAGDCTIAGFLMSLLHAHGPESALQHATAVGACCVQSVDAVSKIPSWQVLGKLVSSGRLTIDEYCETSI